MLGKIVSGIVGGLINAFLGTAIVAIATAGSGGSSSPVVFYGLLLIALVVAWKAPSGKAWRWLLLGAAVASFLLPLASLVFTGQQVAEIGSQAGSAGAAGAAVGGGIFTAVTGLAGFFLGIIFLLLGLLSGRDKTVVAVQANVVSPRR